MNGIEDNQISKLNIKIASHNYLSARWEHIRDIDMGFWPAS